MMKYVADTHSLFWCLTDSPKLGSRANAVFDAGDAGQAIIYVPAIVMAELYFMNRKVHSPLDFTANYRRLETASQFMLLPLLPAEMLDFDQDAAVTEMHDRMVVGAARRIGATLLTNDWQITQNAAVPIVW
jgi:PIN domain nuclease of toxin-antitoxin system